MLKSGNAKYPTTVQISAALQSILSHETLRNSPSVKKFLTYVVNESILRPGQAVKGYSIAIEAFGKPADFDPQNPYIRNLAREVRRALERYYSFPGIQCEVEIEIPVGSYLPVYRYEPRAQFAPQGKHDIETSIAKSSEKMEPTVAVIPFKNLVPGGVGNLYGELVADELISKFSQSPDFKVISILSTMRLTLSDNIYDRAKDDLAADYIVHGNYFESRGDLRVSMQVTEVRSRTITSASIVNVSVVEIAAGISHLGDRLVQEINGSILDREFKRGTSTDPFTLESFTLKISAMQLMHRNARSDVQRSLELLQILAEKNPRSAEPHALTGHWHIMNHNQGWGSSQDAVAKNAQNCVNRALDADPECSLALTIDAVVAVNFFKDFDRGDTSFNLALESNSSNALAWLLKGTMHTFKNEGELAVLATQKARELSPLDPQKYYYDAIYAAAVFVVGDYDHALKVIESSYRINKHHASTLRVRTMLLSTMGRTKEAFESAQELLRLTPNFTVTAYRRNLPAPDTALAERCCTALLAAGVPA